MVGYWSASLAFRRLMNWRLEPKRRIRKRTEAAPPKGWLPVGGGLARRLAAFPLCWGSPCSIERLSLEADRVSQSCFFSVRNAIRQPARLSAVARGANGPHSPKSQLQFLTGKGSNHHCRSAWRAVNSYRARISFPIHRASAAAGKSRDCAFRGAGDLESRERCPIAFALSAPMRASRQSGCAVIRRPLGKTVAILSQA